MWLTISVPAFSGSDPAVSVARVHASNGDRLARGQTLLELTVDLSGGLARDCPPISTCRIVLREEAWLRSMCVQPGDHVSPGEPLALLSDDAGSRPEKPVREARVTVATVLHQTDWWATGS
jgi:pyruvate/2-oxoglutarate dehydrogenase complex dihydrolipoamide acyltransferase (E2) component